MNKLVFMKFYKFTFTIATILFYLVGFQNQNAEAATTESSIRASAYKEGKPTFGIQFNWSQTGMGEQEFSNRSPVNYEQHTLRAQFEVMPVHFAGVWTIGTSLGYHPTPSTVKDELPNVSVLWSVGAQAIYQAKLMTNQWIVPFGGYSTELWSFRARQGKGGKVMVRGPVAGAMFFLNVLDPSNARHIRSETGVQRTYLVGEARFLEGKNSIAELKGANYLVGLRLEI